VLVTRRPGYLLHVEPDGFDVWCAERLASEGRAALEAGDVVTARERLGAALPLWRGRAYGELADEEHLHAAAVHLDDLRVAVLEDRVEADLQLGRHAALCSELEGLVASHPYRERLWSQLMLALYRSGRQADALRAYQRVRRLLGDELGIEPSTLLRELEEAILLQSPELGGRSQVTPGGPIEASGIVPRGVVPRAIARTSFVGRDDDVERLVDFITSLSTPRVITLIGPGGIGKTRLALHAAAAVAPSFRGGVFFVSLAAVADAAAVADTVLSALGGKRAGGVSALQALRDLVDGRRLLLVLDNCEHVAAAAAACADAVGSADGSVVLATGRQPLELPVEQLVPVGALTTPSDIELFSDRARAVNPSFVVTDDNRVTIAEICRRLDGMPLAIELAAARVRSMSVDDITSWLDTRFRLLRSTRRGVDERHQTLHAAVQWSYDLLDEVQQTVFRRLSVFAGGFLSDAVAGVCTEGTMDDFDAVDVLDALVARSMVVADLSHSPTRYSLLETMREFGRDLLDEEGMAEQCRARHAGHYLVTAERARRQMSTRDGAAAVLTFQDEWANLRLAFEWFASGSDADSALRLVLALFWYAQNSFQLELLAWGERAVALQGALDHELWPAVAGATGFLRRDVGDMAGARAMSTAARCRERERGGARRLEPTLSLYAVEWTAGDYDLYYPLLLELEPIAQASADPVELARTRYSRVIFHVVTGLDGLGTAAQDARRDAEATGVPMQLAAAYTGLVSLNHKVDRREAARWYPKARAWARLAGSMILHDNAALWMAIGAADDEPRQALEFVRDCLIDTYARGYWGNFEMVIRPTVVALVRVHRHGAAARLLGGLLTLPGGAEESQELAAALKADLQAALGADAHRLVEEGRDLSRAELAELALSVIDEVLAT
jgi:predicted ATPase